VTASSQYQKETNPILISDVSSISENSVGLKRKLESLMIENENLTKELNQYKKSHQQYKTSHTSSTSHTDCSTSASHSSTFSKGNKTHQQYKTPHTSSTDHTDCSTSASHSSTFSKGNKTHQQYKTPHTSSTGHTDCSTSASHSSTFDLFCNDNHNYHTGNNDYSATGDNYVDKGNLIMANVDFTTIKKSFSSINEHKPQLRLLLKVFDKGHIHLNCKDPLKESSSLQGRFGNCGLT
jgi:hypothetical protein